ncbi:hypothetical protein [Stygiobacter electus]|uniref:Uncharacterized protein n=1 Tax=Stygiobacter electus TaxID=3032292 RepID=A0AAE3P1I5_9BACT|nr:hypothetical protein [Stygiobacter electus]MDF1612672.1 hypothetical protein [Stygiobacter electus]
MEIEATKEKNLKLVKVLSWILIILSAFFILRSFASLRGYIAMINMESITKNFNSSIKINYNLYFIQSVFELLLFTLILISSIFVLKSRNKWRKALIYGLIVSTVFFIVSPIINYMNFPMVNIKMMDINESKMMNIAKTSILIWSFTRSVIISVFFIYVIIKMSKEEIKLLFN